MDSPAGTSVSSSRRGRFAGRGRSTALYQTGPIENSTKSITQAFPRDSMHLSIAFYPRRSCTRQKPLLTPSGGAGTTMRFACRTPFLSLHDDFRRPHWSCAGPLRRVRRGCVSPVHRGAVFGGRLVAGRHPRSRCPVRKAMRRLYRSGTCECPPLNSSGCIAQLEGPPANMVVHGLDVVDSESIPGRQAWTAHRPQHLGRPSAHPSG